MADTIAARVGRIVSGSFNAMIDALENLAPEAVMEQSIREIDGLIDEVRAQLGKTIARKHLASTQLAKDNQRHEELTEQAQLAIHESRDDLASAAVARQMDIEAQVPVLEQTIQDCATQEQQLEGYIQALQAKKRELRDELRHHQQQLQQLSQASANSTSATAGNMDLGQRVAAAESAFDRVLQHQQHSTGSRPDMDNAAKLAELDELARNNRVQERLAALKANNSN